MAALTKFELSIKKSFLDLLEKSLGKDGQASKVFLYCHEGRWMGHVRVSITRPESTANWKNEAFRETTKKLGGKDILTKLIEVAS